MPQTCAELGVMSGSASDGCGDVLGCGTCSCVFAGLPESCWGAVTDPPNAWLNLDCCGSATCVPQTCGVAGISCGRVPDDCGDVLDCGACNADGTCPMGGKAGDCTPCVPRTCATAGFNCDTWQDWCGGAIDCGTCDPCIPCEGGVCSGVLVSMCMPQTCADLGIECGGAGDGCESALDCGECAPSLTCAKGKCLPVCM